MGNNINELPNLDELELDLLGNEYVYYNKIKTPEELNLSMRGLNALDSDIQKLLSYSYLLIDGGGEASKVAGPMGYKYFVKTGTKCKASDTNEYVDRSIYVNNIPGGHIDNTFGLDFNRRRGLIPETIRSINNINPITPFQAFVNAPDDSCSSVSLDTITKTSATPVVKTAYLKRDDIKEMNGCWFSNKINPITNEGCSEGFTNSNQFQTENDSPSIIKNLYFLSLLILICYIFSKK